MSKPPEVSFIVAAFNAAPYIAATLKSALEQTDVTVEVIVVDDASTDETPTIVGDLVARDPRVALIRQASNGGPSRARNIAIDRARGSWMAILDADDLVSPERSRRLIDLAEAVTADVVGDNFARFATNPEIILSTMINNTVSPYAYLVDTATFVLGNVMFDRRARLGYIKPIFRAEFVRSHGIRHQEDIYIGEDYHFWLDCLLNGARFIVTSESFYKYRIRENSLSWRLCSSDIDRLITAHKRTRLEEHCASSTEIKRAAQRYAEALKSARDYTRAVELAKSGKWPEAFRTLAANPSSWSLLLRFGSQALARRLKRVTSIWPRGHVSS